MSKARLVITAVVLEGRPAGQVAAEYGVSKSWLYELLADYRAGASGHQLADRYGLARSTAIELLRKHGVPVRYPRVTPAEAAEMVALYRIGMRQVDIAARFGRDPGNIWHVLKRAGVFGS